jgi:DNA helicase-2/ATP-dependent DNA helicase PcrA
MIKLTDLERAIATFRHPPDSDQAKVMKPAPSEPLFIVAGPGTGKTTSLTFRILKLALVDGVPPKGIVATTFTKKAAEELRSRVLGWGFKLIDALQADKALPQAQKYWARKVDINQIWTGTVDSLCEEILRRYRAPGTQPPILVDEFVSRTIMLRSGLFDQNRWQNADLDATLLDVHSPKQNRFGYFTGKKADLLQNLWERRHQDLVDWNRFVSSAPAPSQAGWQAADAALSAYQAELANRLSVDFSMLEYEVLQRLKAGQLADFTKDLRVLLVDEYQDTNVMQEQLYFEMAAACGGALCVVGDDDQSLYRFRGATVELFSSFPTRYAGKFKKPVQPLFLTFNYRSSKAIIQFVNGYAQMDAGYQAVRVARKPLLQVGPKTKQGVPILGMFRDTAEDLAADLATFIHDAFRGSGASAKGHAIKKDAAGGDVGDCALLCSSPAEYAAAFGDKAPRERLPLLLRNALASKRPAIQLFNPRGEDLTNITLVQKFGGLLLECIDPGAAIQEAAATSGLSTDAKATMNAWRDVAIDFANSASAPAGLVDYATGWAGRKPGRKNHKWPNSVPVVDLIYGLVHFLPQLHDDPEGQVYLEVFTRQLAACEQVGKFKAKVVHDPTNPGLGEASVKELLRDFLAPIAEGLVGVNEELMDTFPRDRLSVLSIHQSKGLEFPLTIVDIGSDFKTASRAHAFKRFPEDGGVPHRLEDMLRPHSPLGAPARSQVDRAFDDIIRQYFVAFSRPQDVLLLVGLTKSAPSGNIANVASGWDRNGVSHWAKSSPIVMI